MPEDNVDGTAGGASFIPLAFTHGAWVLVLALKDFSVDPVELTLKGEIESGEYLFSRECEGEEAADALVGSIADTLEEFRLSRAGDLRGVTPEQVRNLLTRRFYN